MFAAAFARLDHARVKRGDFAAAWAQYIAPHPWDAELRQVGECTFEIVIVVREPAPPSLGLAFGDWVFCVRAALDNGLYAFAAAVSGQDPPPGADRLQFPITTSAEEFRKQRWRLSSLPADVITKLEGVQPYQSPYGPESNYLYWVNDLARTDRHRTLHVGLGTIDQHRVRVGVPKPMTAVFDESVRAFTFIDGELVIARFTTTGPVDPARIEFNPGVGIVPEIREWVGYRVGCRRESLQERMHMTELFMRNHLENLALDAGEVPPGGFRTFNPDAPDN